MKLLLALLIISIGSHAMAEPTRHWVSDGFNNRDLTIHPAGHVLLTTVMAPKSQFAAIAWSFRQGDTWSPLTIAPFSGEHMDIEAMFSPDGKWVYFASKRPRPEREGDDWDLWRVSYSGGQWGEPENLGEPVNTTGNEYYPSLTHDGELFFTATRDEDMREDIFVASPHEGRFAMVKPVTGVNSPTWEFNAFVDPDKEYLLFGSQRRDGEIGGGDIYIAYRDGDGWATPELLGTRVNSTQLDYCPFVFDGRLYYTSEKRDQPDGVFTIESLREAFHSPGNGLGDIYSIPMSEILLGTNPDHPNN